MALFPGRRWHGGVSLDSHDWSDFEIHFSLEIIVQHSKNAKIQPQSCSAVNLRVWNGQGLSRAILRVCSGNMICHCAWCIPWTYSQVQAVWRNFWAKISIEISSCSPPSWDCCLYMSITPCHLYFFVWTEEVHWATPPCCGTHFMIWVIQFYQTLANLCPNAIFNKLYSNNWSNYGRMLMFMMSLVCVQVYYWSPDRCLRLRDLEFEASRPEEYPLCWGNCHVDASLYLKLYATSVLFYLYPT